MTNSQLIWQARTTSAPRPENPAYRELDRYAGELLTIESIRIGIFASKFTATVRYDANTTFEIDVYKAEQQLLLQAGYTLPTTFGEHEFHAEIICKWVRMSSRDLGLQIDRVLPKAEDVQPTPLQCQSAIYWLLKHDSHLQKLVKTVTMHHDIKGKPFIRIQLKAAYKAEVEAIVNPMTRDLLPIFWSVMEHKPFYGMIESYRLPQAAGE